MYKYVVTNGGVDTILHFPSEDAPFILEANLDEAVNTVPQLTVNIPYINTAQIVLFKTFIKVINLKDNSITFEGRALQMKEQMNSDGTYNRIVVFEGLLGILNDAYVRYYAYEKTASDTINYLLWYSNSNNTSYAFNVGTCEFSDSIYLESHYETVLSVLLKAAELVGGEVQARRINNTIYIDMLIRVGQETSITAQMGENMNSLVKEFDVTDVASRVIPISTADSNKTLTISAFNSGNDYLEDLDAKNTYGIIEKVVESTDAKNGLTLKKWGQKQLYIYKQPKLLIECSMVDLSYVAGYSIAPLHLGDSVMIINDVLGIHISVRVLEKQTNLFEPWNPTIKLSSRSYKITSDIIDLKNKTKALSRNTKSSIQNAQIPFEGNVTTTKSISRTITISGTIRDASLQIDISKYVYYTSTGEALGNFPSNVVVKVNGTTVATITGGSASSQVIDVSNNIIQGTNTILITTSANGYVNAILSVNNYLT